MEAAAAVATAKAETWALEERTVERYLDKQVAWFALCSVSLQ